MSMDPLFRIQEEGEGLFKDRGSRFISFAFPVADQEQVDKEVQGVKKRFHDARHHCYAYRLGEYGDTTYATDDGEPSHSAGAPILGAIRSMNITDVLVVVVRYFGGTKLGVRGLIEAYRTGAELALEACPKAEVLHETHFELVFPYERTSELKKILHPFTVKETAASYTDICRLQYAIADDDFPGLEAALINSRFDLKVIEDDLS